MNNQDLIDREEIRNLRILYAHHLDSNNIQALDEVFSTDAVMEINIGKMVGLDAIRNGLACAFELFDRENRGRYPFMHVIANHWIKLTGPDTAEGRCYLVDFETAPKPYSNQLSLLGVYADEYALLQGRWRITRTRLEMVWPRRSDSTEVL